MGNYRNLNVWRRSRRLAVQVYRHTSRFPSREQFGLAGQLRRAVVSVAANIAEGSGRSSDAEYRRFLRIARGSANELSCELQIAMDVDLLSRAHGTALLDEAEQIGAMLTAWIRKLSTPPHHA